MAEAAVEKTEKKQYSSVWVPESLQARIKDEAGRVGIPWTRMLCVLASEALDNRRKER